MAVFRSPKSDNGVAGDGEHLSLDELYKRYRRELVAFIRHEYGSGPPEPEDIVQATFARYAAVSDPSAIQNPRAFLFKIARNILIDQRRHDLATGRDARDAFRDVHEEDHLSEITPERVLLGRERLRQLMSLLDQMPGQRRDIILLHRVDGLTAREIAELFGMPENTVQKQIKRAILDCLKRLDEPDMDAATKAKPEKSP